MANTIPYNFAKRFGVIIGEQNDHGTTLWHRADTPASVFAELQRTLNTPLRLHSLEADEFSKKLTSHYQSGSRDALLDMEGMEASVDLQHLMESLQDSEDLLDSDDDAPIIRLINALFTEAIKQKASDIHVETYQDKVIARFRVDGVLQEALSVQRALSSLIVSRIKVMAKLDIAEKRVPQDGRISLQIANHNVDVRVSTLPSRHGERVVMRLLDKSVSRLSLDHLGMDAGSLQLTQSLLKHPHGIILVTGPTGSGKTTSLYAMLTELNDPSRNILTVEDPIEYELSGIGQTQVNRKVDMTFAKGLRAILRQDPDIVMVGEIRDLETAEIAVQASLTGHLVFSTLHTNTAVGAITRLTDMGVEPFLCASSLVGIIAQRLVRTLCDDCKRARVMTQAEADLLQSNTATQIYEAVGCEACHQLGYQGRIGIYEVIQVNESIREMIHNGDSESIITKSARQTSLSIRHNGFQKILDGQTTLEEVLRVTSE